MTEKYWQEYKRQYDKGPWESNQILKNVKDSFEKQKELPAPETLYQYCLTDNPYIKQIKNSPNITTNTVAELICRHKACEMQYCMALQRKTANRRNTIDLKGCKDQYYQMNQCINNEITRINKKELELRQKIFGQQQLVQVPSENLEPKLLIN